jgi:tRNA(fMet)-specific endonuclease VapC
MKANVEKPAKQFLLLLTILEFTSEDAASYAQVRAKLERAGAPVGPLDTLIAAPALRQLGHLIVSR